MGVNIQYEGDTIFLNYQISDNASWIDVRIAIDGYVNLKKRFHFRYEDIQYKEYGSDFSMVKFVIAKLNGEYFEIPKHIFGTTNNILIHKEKKIAKKYFRIIVEKKLFYSIEEIIQKQVIIGGAHEGAISFDGFVRIVQTLPTDTEIDLYIKKRTSNILNDYVENVRDYGKRYEKYLERKQKETPVQHTLVAVSQYEYEKYKFVLELLNKMLCDYDGYVERDWRNEIIQIVALIYPQYTVSVKELCIKGTVREKAENRYIDIALFDINGNIDVLEIKRPCDEIPLLSKTTYRDNYLPSKDLAGAIMQVEKYIYNLRRMGKEGEKRLTCRLHDKYRHVPGVLDMKVRITNPRGMIIMGRSNCLSDDEKNDFEIIRRKYANIADIITYDDLIQRLESLMSKFCYREKSTKRGFPMSIDSLDIDAWQH